MMAGKEKMMAVRILRLNNLSIGKVEKPSPKHNEALVKVKAVGICGTDIEILKGGHPFAKLPRIPGHEWSGRVEELRGKVTGIQKGDKVVSEVSVGCGKCEWCKAKRYNLCEKLEEVGITRNGAMAEYVTVPITMLHKIPDTVSFRDAALMEPTAIALHGIKIAKQLAGKDVKKNVAIIGDGPIGLLVVKGIKELYNPSKLILTGLFEKKLQRGKSFGAKWCINARDAKGVVREIMSITRGKGADVVIEAAGTQEAVDQAINICKKGGKIVFIGFEGKIDVNKIVFSELELRGSLSSSKEDWKKAIELVSKGKIDTKKLITRKFPLREAKKAFEMVERKKAKVIKVLLTP